MRRLIGFFLVVWLCVWIGAPVCAQTEEDIQGCAKCMHCGMDRQQFAHCRMLLLYDDGSSQGTCSIHCAAVDLAVNIDRTPRSIKVGDYNTKKLVDAESAFWVLGGSKQGVMTRRAKWAFEKKEDAEKFVQENSGEITNFDGAMKAAYEDLWADTKMIREKRKMKKMQTQGQNS